MRNPFKPKIIGVGYMHRWHLIPRNKWFNIYLHKFTGNDDARALHDHPWDSFSIRLKGELKECYAPEKWPANIFKELWRTPPRFCYRPATFSHRLELIGSKPCWTIFITGPRKREWGFHCPKGWQHWSTMTTLDGKTIGGCE